MMSRLRHVFLGTLRGRLVISVALVHAVMMSLFVIDLTGRQSEMLLDRQIEEATALSQTLATSAAGWIVADDISGLQELVEAQRSNPNVVFVVLTDGDGRILAGTDQARLGQFVLDLPRENRLTVLSRTPSLVDVAAPATVGGRQVGWARVGMGQLAVGEKLAEIARNGALYALAAILVGSVIAWFMGRRITRRLYAVQETIDAVRSGERDARSGITGTDEAAVMAGEFNSMLDALGKRDVELRASEERYRSLIEKVQAAIVVHDGQGRVLDSNPLARELLGLTEDALVGRLLVDPGWQLLNEDGSPMVVADYPASRVLASGRPLRDYVVGIRRPGREDITWTLVNAEPEYDDAGAIERLVVSFVDITDRKRAEEESRTLNLELEQRVVERTRDLQQANEELESFSYTVSHDLRSPLRAISGFTSLLERGYGPALDDEGRRLLGVVIASTANMDTLIDGLLGLSRVGRAALGREVVDMDALVRSVAAELSAREPARSISIAIDVLPAVTGDPRVLRQVFDNLIANALKFTRPRAETRIEVRADEGPDEVVYSVRDNGVGFDPAFADKLFGVFQRLHPAAEFEGTGIGLATVSRIVTRHGGRVWAESVPDSGATFFVALPKDAPVADA